MAGVTDLPFRQLCRQLGAGMVVGEMVASNPSTRNSRKTQLRLNHDGEPEPIAVQIVGGDPEIMAEADRKSTRLNSSHVRISYAVFCLKKKILTAIDGIQQLELSARSQSINDTVV